MASREEMRDHIEYDRIEEDLNAALAVSLDPRGPDVLFECIARLGLGEGSVAVDVGCGAGRQSLELARRFQLDVRGFDPLERYVDAQDAAAGLGDAGRVSFGHGTAEALPMAGGAADLVLYREMLYLVDDLDAVLAEGRRVLKPSGRAVVYQLFNTPWLEPRERERFWPRHAVERFGRAACDIKLIDAFWFIYRMIGKLTQRLYVLRPG